MPCVRTMAPPLGFLSVPLNTFPRMVRVFTFFRTQLTLSFFTLSPTPTVSFSCASEAMQHNIMAETQYTLYFMSIMVLCYSLESLFSSSCGLSTIQSKRRTRVYLEVERSLSTVKRT